MFSPISDFRRDLVRYYRTTGRSIPISPLIPEEDAELSKIYVCPKIVIKEQDALPALGHLFSPSQLEDETKVVSSYAKLLYRDKKLLRSVYIQGEPGIGKSAFCTKLATDWCDALEYSSCATGSDKLDMYFNDLSTLSKFDYLFLISLRNATGQDCNVDDIINTAIINELRFDHDQNYSSDFLKTVLSTESCLIVLDGLDEWRHPVNNNCCRLPSSISHRAVADKCTYVTLPRPWKLVDAKLRSSDIDILFELKGVVDHMSLVEKVIACLNKKYRQSRRARDFMSWSSDLIAMQLICLWFEKKREKSVTV